LKEFCAEKHLTNRVTFLGQIDWIARLFSSATIVVVPSEWEEAFGFVVAEAMACGACLLSSDAGAIPEVIGSGGEAGLLFHKGDPADLSEKLYQLLTNPARRDRMRIAARARAVEHFSIERMVDGYVSLYEELDHSLTTRSSRCRSNSRF